MKHLDFLLHLKAAVDQALTDHEEAIYWRAEAERLEELYSQTLTEDIKHSEIMMGNVLRLVLQNGDDATAKKEC